MCVLLGDLLSDNLKEGVDWKQTVYDNCNQEPIQSDFDDRLENVFEGYFGLAIDSYCDSSEEEEGYFEVPVDLLFRELDFR